MTYAMKPPATEELAAIAAAIATVTQEPGAELYDRVDRERRVAAWQLAMRLPDLEFDDLLALRHACSIRF